MSASTPMRRSSRANAGRKTEYKGMPIISTEIKKATRGKKRRLSSNKSAKGDTTTSESKTKRSKEATVTDQDIIALLTEHGRLTFLEMTQHLNRDGKIGDLGEAARKSLTNLLKQLCIIKKEGGKKYLVLKTRAVGEAKEGKEQKRFCDGVFCESIPEEPTGVCVPENHKAVDEPWAKLHQYIETDDIEACPRTRGDREQGLVAERHFPHQNPNDSWCHGVLCFHDEDKWGNINGKVVTAEHVIAYDKFLEAWCDHRRKTYVAKHRTKNLALIKKYLVDLKINVWDPLHDEASSPAETIKNKARIAKWIKRGGSPLTYCLPQSDKELEESVKEHERKAEEQDKWVSDHHDPTTGECKHEGTETQRWCPVAIKWSEEEHDDEGQCKANHKHSPLYYFCPKNHVSRLLANGKAERDAVMAKSDSDTILEFLPEFKARIVDPLGGIDGALIDKIDDETADGIAEWMKIAIFNKDSMDMTDVDE